MFGMSLPDPDQLQGTLVDFALIELIRQHRLSFQPLWSVDSWAKLMIWLALNCGLSSDKENFEHFAQSLGERITTRLRRTFFERELADLSFTFWQIQLMLRCCCFPRHHRIQRC